MQSRSIPRSAQTDGSQNWWPGAHWKRDWLERGCDDGFRNAFEKWGLEGGEVGQGKQRIFSRSEMRIEGMVGERCGIVGFGDGMKSMARISYQ
jgi:hypothetical protein